MNQQRNNLDRAAEKLLQSDSASFGDERERAVYTEAATFGMTAGLYLGFMSAFVAALLGLILAPVLLLAYAVIPVYFAMWYAARRGVQTIDLASRASDRTLRFQAFFSLAFLLLTIGAMGYTGWAGHGLLPLHDLSVLSPDSEESVGSGALVGGSIGAVLGVIATGIAIRRARNKRAAELDHPDSA